MTLLFWMMMVFCVGEPDTIVFCLVPVNLQLALKGWLAIFEVTRELQLPR